MSIQSNMRVLPIVVQKYPFIDHKSKFFGRGKVSVEILEPMKIFDHESVDEFAARTYQLMNSEFKRLNSLSSHQF